MVWLIPSAMVGPKRAAFKIFKNSDYYIISQTCKECTEALRYVTSLQGHVPGRLTHAEQHCFLWVAEMWILPEWCSQRQWNARYVWCFSGISLMSFFFNGICVERMCLLSTSLKKKHVPMWKFKVSDDSRLTPNKLRNEHQARNSRGWKQPLSS